MTFDAGRIRHDAVLMHYSRTSNGSAAPSNWKLSATGDTGLAWTPEASGAAVSYGSNTTDVAEILIGGVATSVARSDHYHSGIREITSSSSNTLQRGVVHLVGGTGVGLTATDTDGDGEFDTVTFSSFGGGTGGGASVSYGSNATTVGNFNAGGASTLVSSADHVHRFHFPLDNYAIDGTYGDDFTGTSLAGIWTRRTFASTDETWQVGPEQTWLRLATASRGAGTGYFQTAPGGDWTFAMKFILHGAEAGWGLAVVDTNGTGLQFSGVYSAHTPYAPLLLQLTTYSTYGGAYVEPGIPGSSPNVNIYVAYPIEQTQWMYLRKSGTSYFGSISHDGEVWGKESASITWSGTVDRVGMIFGPLGNAGGTSLTVDVDWFNRIA